MRYLDQPDDQLPLFVYGTLRRGQENYSLMRGHTLTEFPATLHGMALYSLYSYPMIVEGDSTVYGDLVTLHPRVYSRLLEDLDQLEGYDPQQEQASRFRRVRRCVKTQSGLEVHAWVYVGQSSVLDREPHVAIVHGDWIRHRRELIRGTRFGRFELGGE